MEAKIGNKVYKRKMVRGYNRRVRYKEFQVGTMALRGMTLKAEDPTNGKLGPTVGGGGFLCGQWT